DEEAAKWIKENMDKPVAGFVGGATAPKGKRMGHAGAIISGGEGTASAKQEVMRECGIKVAEYPSKMGEHLIEFIEEKGIKHKCKRIGYDGAIIYGGEGTEYAKQKVMRERGIKVAESPAKMGETLIEFLEEKGIKDKCKTH